MKTPQDTTLLMQALVSIVFAIAFVVLIVYSLIYHNATIIPYALGGLATIYAHWVSSPAQQSMITSLIQQITPLLTSLAQSQQSLQQKATAIQQETSTPKQD